MQPLTTLAPLDLNRVEDALWQAAADYRYASEQLNRAAQQIRLRRLEQAEQAIARHIEGIERAWLALAEMNDPTPEPA